MIRLNPRHSGPPFFGLAALAPEVVRAELGVERVTVDPSVICPRCGSLLSIVTWTCNRCGYDAGEAEVQKPFQGWCSPNVFVGPAQEMAEAFRAHTEGQTKFTRRMCIAIADMFGMSPREVVRQYERMGLLKRGTWEWFRENGGITAEHIREARADREPVEQPVDRGADGDHRVFIIPDPFREG